MALFCRVRRLGDAPDAREIRARYGAHADACLLSVPIRDNVAAGSCGKLASRRPGTGFYGKDSRNEDFSAIGFAVGFEARGAGIRQLYLTAISAGGSRP